MVFVEGRFVVEGIDVGRAAVQEQVNDAFGLGGKVWLLGRERGVEVAGRACCVPERITHDTCQGKRTHAHTAAAEQLPAGQKAVFASWLVTVHRFLHRVRKLRARHGDPGPGQVLSLPRRGLVTRPGPMACRASLSIASSGRP